MNSALKAGQRLTFRGFHTSRARLSHGPHYPEGPRTNIPWTPKGKWNIRAKLFGFYGTSHCDCGLTVAGLGFGLPVIASWWQLYHLPFLS